MSLDTVLKIGNALRNAPDSLKYFKYVSACPTDKDGNYPLCISIPILKDFNVNWNGIKEVPENQRDKLYYLRFKTSDNDGLTKYIFGDIYYLTSTKIRKDDSIEKSEGGGYRLENPSARPPYDKNSFERAIDDFEDIIKNTDSQESNLLKFRSALHKDLDILENILANISAIEYFLKNPTKVDFLSFIHSESLISEYTIQQLLDKTSKQNLKKLGIDVEKEELSEENKLKLLDYDYGEIFINFEFSNGENWYDFDEDLELINKKMLLDFVEESKEGLVLKKTLYKTLCSGDKKNDIQFPNFDLNSKYKAKAFSEEAIKDLFYAIDFSKKGTLISYTDIKIIILPRGNNLTAKDYMNFHIKRDEEKVKKANSAIQLNSGEPLFDIFEEPGEENITTFDVVFSKKGGATSPDVDLIEVTGIEKSKIRRTKQRILDISHKIFQKRKDYFSNTTKEFYGFRITSSFQNIIGSPQSDSKTGKVSIKANSRYQSHILKVLPLIYTDNYYDDDQLLPSCIQNVEYSTRAGDPKYNFLRFDLEFLISIQNNQNNKFMNIINSESYQLGKLLGILAKNFAGDRSPIKSFEKNYVGNLSRRISNMSDFISLKNDIEQKLIMHDKTKFTHQVSYELAQKIIDFKDVYNREECAFGFFESYFKPIAKKPKTEQEVN